MSGYSLFWSVPDTDVRKQLSGRSAFFHDMEHTLFVAEREGWPVARCAALINRAWQSSHGTTTTGFIGYLAARPDAVADTVQMLERAADWLSERGIRNVIAPFNGSSTLGFGLLTDGFDESPMFPFSWNPPYYRDYLEAAGYAPSYPLWVFEIDFGSGRYRDALQRAQSASQCDIRPIDKLRWNRDLEILRELFNAGMREEWEMHQFTAAEFKELLHPIWRIALDPRLITQFILDDGRPIGFVIGATDLVPLFRSFRGRMGPVQLLRLLRSGRVRTRAAGLAGAMLPEYRGRRFGMMAARFFHDLQEMGYKSALYFPVNDGNVASRALAQALGARGRVLYHCFDKRIE